MDKELSERLAKLETVVYGTALPADGHAALKDEIPVPERIRRVEAMVHALTNADKAMNLRLDNLSRQIDRLEKKKPDEDTGCCPECGQRWPEED